MKNERDENMITQLLYESDGMLTEFDATVTEVSRSDDGAVRAALDRTAFFPEGGGQQADTGLIITGTGEKIKVTDVKSEDGQVWHYIEGALTPGDAVRGCVDAKIRYARMQIHGAEHLLSGIIHNLFGYENTGFHMSEGEAVFDVSGPLTDEQIRDVERRANMAVFENVPVTVSFPSPEEAEKTEYRSKLDTYEGIRLVTIEGYDVCACCAPHVNSTGQLGVIKIISHMPHRGGMRMTMTAGMEAYGDYVRLHDSNAEIVAMLSSKRNETAASVSDLKDRMASLKEENVSIRREMTELVTKKALEEIKSRAEGGGPVPVFAGHIDPKGLRDLVNECTKAYGGPVCAFMGEEGSYRYIFAVRAENAESADLRGFTRRFNEECSGKGGGSALMTEGNAAALRSRIEEFFERSAAKS